MAADRLYAKLYARVLEDPRLFAASRRMGAALRCSEDLARLALLGLIESIDLWLVERGEAGEDGLLPGDGYGAIRRAATTSPEIAEAALRALIEVGFLQQQEGGMLRAGFRDDYSDLIGARVYQRNRRAGKTMRRSPTRRRRVADRSPTCTPTPADPRSETSEPQTSTASPDSVPEPAVDLAVRTAAAPASATAPGGNGARPCPHCVDGLVVRRGGKPRCCRACPRGRERGRSMARAIQDEQASKTRAVAARVELSAGLRGGGPVAMGGVLQGVLLRLGAPRAGPPPPSGLGPGAA